MKFLGSGKVKDMYSYDEQTLLFRFSDRVSAYDVKFSQTIPKKGSVLCKFAEFWFDTLDTPHHMVRRVSDTEMLVKKMTMIPLECVVRGYLYGSLAERWSKGTVCLPKGASTELAARLPEPIFDPTTKSKHDVPIDQNTALEMGLVTKDQFDWLSSKSIDIYKKMHHIADSAGYILADLKLEFGVCDRQIILGDSIGPDECRLWPKKLYSVGRRQEAYDKQILRDWLAENGHAEKFEDARNRDQEPIPPQIPPEIISKMTQRYVSVYRDIAGHMP